MTTAPGEGVAAATIQDAAPPPPPKPAKLAKSAKAKTHKVRRGETLSSIVRKFECDLGDLAKANKLKAPKYAIKPGQSLKLEGCNDP